MNDVVKTAATGELSLKEKRQAHAAKMRAAAKAKREAKAVAAPTLPASSENEAQQLVASALGKMAIAEGEAAQRKAEKELLKSRSYTKDGGTKVPKMVKIILENSLEVAENGLVPFGHNGAQYLLRIGVEAEVPEFILANLDDAVVFKPITDPVTKKYTGRLVPQKRFNYRRVA